MINGKTVMDKFMRMCVPEDAEGQRTYPGRQPGPRGDRASEEVEGEGVKEAMLKVEIASSATELSLMGTRCLR